MVSIDKSSPQQPRIKFTPFNLVKQTTIEAPSPLLELRNNLTRFIAEYKKGLEAQSRQEWQVALTHYQQITTSNLLKQEIVPFSLLFDWMLERNRKRLTKPSLNYSTQL